MSYRSCSIEASVSTDFPQDNYGALLVTSLKLPELVLLRAKHQNPQLKNVDPKHRWTDSNHSVLVNTKVEKPVKESVDFVKRLWQHRSKLESESITPLYKKRKVDESELDLEPNINRSPDNVCSPTTASDRNGDSVSWLSHFVDDLFSDNRSDTSISSSDRLADKPLRYNLWLSRRSSTSGSPSDRSADEIHNSFSDDRFDTTAGSSARSTDARISMESEECCRLLDVLANLFTDTDSEEEKCNDMQPALNNVLSELPTFLYGHSKLQDGALHNLQTHSKQDLTTKVYVAKKGFMDVMSNSRISIPRWLGVNAPNDLRKAITAYLRKGGKLNHLILIYYEM
ncbi:hypothetical protein VNI00_006305 [Paramarasmius palmivorus]|uniref:Uncharacterized protein n=1 Tax=Paramarasmius palmivorus TaxID=297713 RepID=A0AAW0DB37_9AGAR